MSGIYVKGMEMPKDGEHPYWVTIHSDGTVEYNENKGQGWQTSEAVPVPDHGDLIDRDGAVRDLRMDYAYAAAKIVALQPTIIPADKEGEA